MTAIAILGGLFFIGVGALYLFAPDLMWALQRWGNSMEGQASERSGAWEFRRVLGGVVFIVGGIVFMVWGLSLD
jgi:hypothetical protein